MRKSTKFVVTTRTAWLSVAAIGGAALLVSAIIASSSRCNWTGFGRCVEAVPNGAQLYRAKTLWDWLQLLIIPIVLALGGALFARAQKARELRLAQDRQREDALQRYFDDITELIISGNLKVAPVDPAPGSEAERTIRVNLAARARTRTLLMRLDGARKGEAIRFLEELHLIREDNKVIPLSHTDLRNAHLAGLHLDQVCFDDADLRSANLQAASLPGASLNRAKMRCVNLSGAYLSAAKLYEADLTEAILDGANLEGCFADGAKFVSASLKGVRFAELIMRDEQRNLVPKRASLAGADFTGAVLEDVVFKGANLRRAKFVGARLRRSDFTGADLADAVLTNVSFIDCQGVSTASHPRGSGWPS